MAPTAEEVLKDWWPDQIRHWIESDPLTSEYVKVAGVDETASSFDYHRLSATGLVATKHRDEILTRPGGIGYEVSANGPHPSWNDGDEGFVPRFWIEAGGPANELESLTTSWRAGNQLVVLPDPKFLMTYGLMLRPVGDGDLHWDDVEEPKDDVVVVKPVSKPDVMRHPEACVEIRSDYLRDYSTIRQQSMIQVFYVQCTVGETTLLRDAMAGKKHISLNLPGRLLDLRYVHRDTKVVLVQIRGTRPLVEPGAAPITGGRWDYGELHWPGIDGPVTDERAHHFGHEVVAYVEDTVLDNYEGRSGFETDPETGAVWYGSQWGVTWTQRVGRNLVRVVLKKLYEGNRPETVELWHASEY